MISQIRLTISSFLAVLIVGCALGSPKWAVSSPYSTAPSQNERCTVLRNWVNSMKVTYSRVYNAKKYWIALSRGFVDENFSSVFGVTYFSLNDSQKKFINNDVNTCESVKGVRFDLSTAFVTNSALKQGAGYKGMLELIKTANSPKGKKDIEWLESIEKAWQGS